MPADDDAASSRSRLMIKLQSSSDLPASWGAVNDPDQFFQGSQANPVDHERRGLLNMRFYAVALYSGCHAR
jgi:hypothetical protein